ncbi:MULTISPECIES: cupin domain-containing protein [unclassified Moorena]|uniref:cupin domain-containing protein n=1 Tax=unclassified Moorena TaxID=2683338 RepID=UPI0013BE5A48|nr:MULTISPECIES: cupin domain-containing protein [unclassified Moorena]NEQ12734.1 hypothetical protein [Moorena sp. SIO3E2]NER90284.1 hypothetical protein [Moorena sp. SIO3A2]NES42785.1 hypothetical protein [Moorena sp. SIO2C4]
MDEHKTGIARNTIIDRLRLSLVSLILVPMLFLFNTPIALGQEGLIDISPTPISYDQYLFQDESYIIDTEGYTASERVFNLTVSPITEWDSECLDDCRSNLTSLDTSIEKCKTENVFFGLTFNSEKSKGGEQKDIYPLQPHWVFKINSPSDVTQAEIKNLGQCPIKLVPTQSEPLELWSGFKVKGDPAYETVNVHPSLGNFVPKKVYYYENGGTKVLLGALKTISASNFPALGAGVWGDIMIMPESIRAPHWHMTEAESGFCYQGYGKVGAIVDKDIFPSSDGSGYANDRLVEEIFIHPDEIFMFPTGAQHYLRNIGSVPFKCILFLRHGVPTNPNILSAITLQNVLGQTPLGVSAAFTNPKDPELVGFSEFIEGGSEEPYKDAASISNYQNEAFKPSTSYQPRPDQPITIKSADADCTGAVEWMTKYSEICPNGKI